jgi:SAM-dependent methyltransferase
MVPELLLMLAEYGVSSILDVGCGDNFWFPDLEIPYLGIDPVAQAIERARARRPARQYIHGSLGAIELPWVPDLVISRDVMQHLSLGDGARLLGDIEHTGTRLMLLSHYVDAVNEPIQTGGGYRPNLRDAPFFLDEPVTKIFDGWGWDDPHQVRDAWKYLGLWRNA